MVYKKLILLNGGVVMSENKHTVKELYEMQSWNLKRKIATTKTKIIEAYNHYNGNVYISFSGGKDSTVLLHIARQIYPNIKSLYVNTSLEFPEITKYVSDNQAEDDTILYPVKYNKHTKEYDRTNFRSVICENGYPVISKEVSECVYNARRFINKIIEKEILRGVQKATV